MTLSQQFYAIALDKARAHKKVTDSSDDKWLLSSALLDAEATIDSLRRERGEALKLGHEMADRALKLERVNQSLNSTGQAVIARAESAEAENAQLREALKPYWHVVWDETA